MKKSFEIESDCLDIISRIKSIDNDYFVMYNPDKDKFELHSHAQAKNTYCLTFPFETLDERAYFHTLKTRVQNCDEIFEKIDEENRKLEQAQIKHVLKDFEEKMYDSY